MEFQEVVRKRRMVRGYDTTRPVSRYQVDALLECALRAPSAGFSQGWHFLVLDTPEPTAAYWSVTTDPQRPLDTWLTGMQTAPVLIVAFSDRSRYDERYRAGDKSGDTDLDARWPVPYWHTDTAMAALLLLLGAVDDGLAGCFFGVPADRVDALRTAFGVPDRLVPVGVVSVGYPGADRRSPSLRRGRRSRDEVVSYGRFGG